MSISPKSEPNSSPRAWEIAFVLFLWLAIGCCVLSCVTIPFAGKIWLGEIPVLGLFQQPKIFVADWLRVHVVMKAITFCGLSRGSFSPDYVLARPYALAITYLIPMVIIGFIGLRRSRFAVARRGLLTIMFFIAASVDFLFTLVFAGSRSLTLY